MHPDSVVQGSLFTTDFLSERIAELEDWRQLDDVAVGALGQRLRIIVESFPRSQNPNESQTEDDLIWPVLAELGWTASLRQQNLAPRGREDVPDGILFADAAAKARANRCGEEWKRYEFGLVVVESKRWQRPLDRRSSRRGEETAPSTQMLRYLRRVDDLTTGVLRWGILTNGLKWRLYYQGARSVSEQFFEVDLGVIFDLPGHNEGLFALDAEARAHWFKVFALIFRRDAFLPSPADQRTFHQRAIEEGHFYERRVAASLSDLVFENVFPRLARAIGDNQPDAPLKEVRQASLVLLYRLLFILYAEDRNLLPVRDPRYDDYGLRERVREDVGRRMDLHDTFSDRAARYWSIVQDLCRAIDQGDGSIGLPPYDGGLFDEDSTPLLEQVRIADADMAPVIDALSFERLADGRRRYINYRDLSVQQLGSIYERLLEYELVREGPLLDLRPNVFARKTSGSYYTPDELVALILKETITPLTATRLDAFHARVEALQDDASSDEERKLRILKGIDPAEAILGFKICDPAMGSGHFLVSLVDVLADQVIAAMAEAEAAVPEDWGQYVSPLAGRIEQIRITIERNAGERGWSLDPEQLDDRHIIRRMVLKRCVYGVDKNSMAVELAKVSLWLHTFTTGAPLSFLDHHLRCGDSLFGEWVRRGIDRAEALGGPLLLYEPIRRALRAASKMQIIEGLTDAEIAEAHRSADVFHEVRDMTAPLSALLSLIHALAWLNPRGAENRAALHAFFDGQFGDPVQIALGKEEPRNARPEGRCFNSLLAEARILIAEEHFLHWQVAFPGVWRDWEEEGLVGGFDAVIGNPPWDRMKLQQVEWFAARRREIAMAPRAADRRRLIAALREHGDPLSDAYGKADARAEAAKRLAREQGDYPLLSGGDINLYSLFVERAMALVKPEGMVGLLTPSGIASDLTASRFFKSVATEGRLHALYDFENGRQGLEAGPYFPDVHRSFKFCTLVFGKERKAEAAKCAFYLHDVGSLADPNRCFPITSEEFARVNPNTGTAPLFRSRRDAELTTTIYGRLPVLVDRSGPEEVRSWPVRYATMFHMTNDSRLFRTRLELEEREGAYHVGGNRFRSAGGEWVPLYVGRMIHQFDHRAASVAVNPENLHNPALSDDISAEEKADPAFLPQPQYWVPESAIDLPDHLCWTIAFRDIARATDARTMIAAAVPRSGFGNKLPLLILEYAKYKEIAPLLVANLNSILFDFVARSKVHSTTFNWYILEQMPLVPPICFDQVRFGARTANEIVREATLELTYTAQDMEVFARDMGYVDEVGEVRPPFRWDEEHRLRQRARLDAVFFHLYGVTNRDDVRHVYSTFPIIAEQEQRAYGRYRSCELCLAYMSALAAGDSDAQIAL